MTLHSLLGLTGALVVVIAYFCNQQGWLRSNDWRYPGLNMAGAGLILISLLDAWNLPSVVIEVFWIGISFYGLIRALAARTR